jgi:hypothetical protein
MEDYEDIITDYENVPTCTPSNSCEIIQEFINTENVEDEYHEIHRKMGIELNIQKSLRMRMEYLSELMTEIQNDLNISIDELDKLDKRYLELYRNRKNGTEENYIH